MNPYKVLGIRPNASLEEIKSAYENLSNTYSIDNFKDSPEEPFAEDKLSELNDAYTLLINDMKYKNIRNLIENEQFLSAETELNLIGDKHSAEWNYLQGFVLLKKGWFKAGVTHLRTAAELSPDNPEYKETIMLLNKKIATMKRNYARAIQYRNLANSSNNNSMCGGSSPQGNNSMCGGSGGGGGIDPNLLNMFMNNNGAMGGANPMGSAAANPGSNATNANPLGGAMGGGNPMQNLLMQSLLGGGNGMNMCGNSGGGMC